MQSNSDKIFVGTRTYIEIREGQQVVRVIKPAREEGRERFIDVPTQLFVFVDEKKAVMIGDPQAVLCFDKEWHVGIKDTGDNGQFVRVEFKDAETNERRG